MRAGVNAGPDGTLRTSRLPVASSLTLLPPTSTTRTFKRDPRLKTLARARGRLQAARRRVARAQALFDAASPTGHATPVPPIPQ